jgi:Protein of unknown function (DUF2490)
MTIKIFTFLSLILLFNLDLTAQKTVTNQSLYWLRYYNQLTLNNKLIWHNEIEDRRFFEHNRQHHLIIHSRLHYKFLQNADAAFGLTYSLQSPQDPNATIDMVVPENRIVQEFNLSNPLTKRLTIQQRLRIEERFIHKNNGKELLDGYDFNFRFRFRLQANCTISEAEAKNITTLKVSDELMINVGKAIVYNQFDQNRIYVGIEQGLGKGISAELGYLYWYQQRASGNQFFERDIIRFTLNHKIKL